MERIDIILPLLNEATSLPETIRQLQDVFADRPEQPHLILVDDGSTDATWESIQRLHTSSDVPITGLSLSRNFGKEAAMLAGIRHSTGAAVILMDADLQHPPHVVAKLIDVWKDTRCDIVHARKQGRRNESDRNAIFVTLFYLAHRLCAGIDIAGASDFKLLSRRAAAAYADLNERNLFFRGLIPWLGFHQETIDFSVAARRNGKTKWRPLQRLTIGVRAITSFSTLPLHLVTFFGAAFLFASAILTSYTLLEWFRGNAPAGFTTIIILLLMIGSVTMLSLGIIGQYLARIYEEVKGRPQYVIKSRFEANVHHDQHSPH